MDPTTTSLTTGDLQSATIRLTVAHAIIRFLANQFIEIDGCLQRVCAGGFGIFDHGKSPYASRDELPLYRGQNEQRTGFAAAVYAKAQLRRRFMICIASAGPGAANLLTAATLAHANRLPDPVLQQPEHFGNPVLGVTDAFRAGCRNWDRITYPAHILNNLPVALNTMPDPADCGSAFLSLTQDLQGWADDFPAAFFAASVHRFRHPAPDPVKLALAVSLLSVAKCPLIIAGDGVQHSGEIAELTAFAERHAIPVVETIAGRANLLWDHPVNSGPLGVTGSDSANTVATSADVIFAVGTRLKDFTTGSWSAFANDSRIIDLNAARHDASKNLSRPLVFDARTGLAVLEPAHGKYRAPTNCLALAQAKRKKRNAVVAHNIAPRNGLLSDTKAASVVEFSAAFARAKKVDRTNIIVIKVDPHNGWTDQGHAWREVGTPEISTRDSIGTVRAKIEVGHVNQWRGL